MIVEIDEKSIRLLFQVEEGYQGQTLEGRSLLDKCKTSNSRFEQPRH